MKKSKYTGRKKCRRPIKLNKAKNMTYFLTLKMELEINGEFYLSGSDIFPITLSFDSNEQYSLHSVGKQRYIIKVSKKIELSKKRFEKLLDKEKDWEAIRLENLNRIKLEFLRDLLSLPMDTMTKRSFNLWKLYQWKLGIAGPENVLKNIWSAWEIKQENEIIPNNFYKGKFGVAGIIDNTLANYEELIAREFQNEFEIPLGHTFIREAHEILDKSIRSSLVLLATGLEVGIKQSLTIKLPEATWLIMNAPTPPLHTIIREYYPTLYPQFAVNKEITDLIRKVSKLRNELVHQGKFNLSESKIQEYIFLAKDFLYYIDYIQGHIWAKEIINRKDLFNF